MPRKPKVEKKSITVLANGRPLSVKLHPPTKPRRTWYAYWPGLKFAKSTGETSFADAAIAAEEMVRNNGERPTVRDTLLSDEEFEAIQRVHFSRKQDPAARERSVKSLTVCLEAIGALKTISGLPQITLASADDCAAFQRKALTVPKNWRQQHPKSKKQTEVACLSPNTVLKWSRSLQAAFERANRNAGKKCVRGVVPEAKLLSVNPWSQFDWIEGRKRPLRQFDANELISLLDFFETGWTAVTVAVMLTKFLLWSSCRQQEATGLKWSSLRRLGGEVHFEIVGKWGVERWVRIPLNLFSEFEAIRTQNDYVFSAYNAQLRQHHESTERFDNARRVGPYFKPLCLGDWFADRIDDWSATLNKGHAHTHVFRKTSLQYVRSGEDVNRQVATDARVSESVLMTSYVKETDEQLRQASNRTFARIVASLPPELARRCGHIEAGGDFEKELRQAIEAKDWQLAATIAARMATQQPTQAS